MNTPTVLITGALTGIGRATALAFAHEGARVVVSGRHDDEGQKLATELRKLGTEAEFVRTDVRHEEEVKNLVDKTIARFGRLDIAVNSAGTEGTPGSAADVTTENYQTIFDTNVLGVLLSMKYEIRAMLRQGKGSIVNISSAYGKVGGPTAAVYVGSKHAVEGITKSAAIELAGTGVRVNIVGPGPVETGMFNRFAQTKENKANFLDAQVPNKRIGTPEEIANAIVFIGSDKASYIIGASLAVDGGMIADWGIHKPYAYLKNIKQPVLIINGSNDVIIYTVNSFILQRNLPNAQLILYPDSNHGSQYQFPELFVEHVTLFLAGPSIGRSRETLSQAAKETRHWVEFVGAV